MNKPRRDDLRFFVSARNAVLLGVGIVTVAAIVIDWVS